MVETKTRTAEAVTIDQRVVRRGILRLNLIGQMEAWAAVDQSSVLPLGRKTRALLAVLALAAPRPIGRPRLAELLWSRRHEEQARASLRQEIHRLLDALQPVGGDILLVTRDHVSLRLDQVSLDVEDVLLATPTEPAGLDLLKGRLLDEFDGLDPAFDVWLAGERERMQDRTRSLAEILLRQQTEPDGMIAVAQRLLGIDRTHEGAWRTLMEAYAARGDRGMAVQTYERCRVVLKEKLDAAPSAETQRLVAGIRAGAAAPSARLENAASERPSPARPGIRIGVLPLQMLGTDAADAHLSMSLADGITAALSLFRWVHPVSRGALQEHSSRDEAALGRAFNLGFLVDGTVQRSGSRLRITIRLLDLDDNSRVAVAHQMDRDAGDLLSLQDDVATDVIGQIMPEIMRAECRRAAARPLPGASAYDLIMRAMPLLGRLRRDDFDEAGELIRRALTVDPEFAAAHAFRAHWLTLQASQGWAPDLEATRNEAGEHGARAITLDPGDARCLAIAGHVRAVLHHQPREALVLHDRALAVNPNMGLAVGLSALTLTYLGDLEGAASRFERFSRLAADSRCASFIEAERTLLEILRRDHAAAVQIGRRFTELNPHSVVGLKHYLAALGHAGPPAEAKAVLRRLLVLDPGFSIDRPAMTTPFERDTDAAHYVAGLRLAGAGQIRAAVA